MGLDSGSSLAHYRIGAAIGAGGMGEVYRATDTKLGREVALKLLPEALPSDRDRLARFEREAKVLASLNHPGIAHLYDFDFEEVTLEGGAVGHVLVMGSSRPTASGRSRSVETRSWRCRPAPGPHARARRRSAWSRPPACCRTAGASW